MTTNDKYCSPRHHLGTTYWERYEGDIDDIKKKCSNNPRCHMFYRIGGENTNFASFKYCEGTASIKACTPYKGFYNQGCGNVLYTKRGNKTCSLIFRAC